MWNDNVSDGCVYDTMDCYHDCYGCRYGYMVCGRCERKLWHPNTECQCDEKELAIQSIKEQRYFSRPHLTN